MKIESIVTRIIKIIYFKIFTLFSHKICNNLMRIFKLFFLVLNFSIFNIINAQINIERTDNYITPFLNRMANKGLINIDLDQTNLPFNSQTIIDNLDSLQKKIYLLNLTEQKELLFFKKMYAKKKIYFRFSTTLYL